MIENLRRFSTFSHLSVTWRDAVDILVVAVLVYSLLRLIRGTRAVQMVFGIVTAFALYEIAVFARLTAVRTVLQAVVFYLPLAVIVLFAQELRRALAAFGRNPLFAWFSGYHAEETISDIVLAATSLSARRVGALIVCERREGLKNYIENGVRWTRPVARPARHDLHAGTAPTTAVIIAGERVAAAACFLPLSLQAARHRHRAAIGITADRRPRRRRPEERARSRSPARVLIRPRREGLRTSLREFLEGRLMTSPVKKSPQRLSPSARGGRPP